MHFCLKLSSTDSYLGSEPRWAALDARIKVPGETEHEAINSMRLHNLQTGYEGLCAVCSLLQACKLDGFLRLMLCCTGKQAALSTFLRYPFLRGRGCRCHPAYLCQSTSCLHA